MHKAQAIRAIDLLKPVKFSTLNQHNDTVQSETTSTISEVMCVVCCVNFEGEDEVAELECDKRHIFHKECLLPWLEKALTCPTCRTEVNID